jgi:uncharacterized protein involved in exopolysaccharide biosynthesis
MSLDSSPPSRPQTAVVEASTLEIRPRAAVTVTPAAGGGGFSLDDVYYAVFRHKWKILICTCLGLIAGTVVYLTDKPSYFSNAKLFVRYVVSEGRAARSAADDTITKAPDRGGETIMSAEQEILTSLDLIRLVAQSVGPEKILAAGGGGNDLSKATAIAHRGLSVNAPRFSSVINLTMQHQDPEIAQLILRQLIEHYLKMHQEIHRSAGMVGDFLAQETDQLRSRLAQTEEDLRKAKAKVGVVSVEEAKRGWATQMEVLRQQVFAAETEKAQRSSVLEQMAKRVGVASGRSAKADENAGEEAENEKKEPQIPPAVFDEFRSLSARRDFLIRREQELLVVFTAENSRVKETRTQLGEVEAQLRKIEEAHPALVRTVQLNPSTPRSAAPSSGAGPERAFDFEYETTQLRALDARIASLNKQIEFLRKEAALLDQAEGAIQEMTRKRQLEEANFLRYSASLEQSRINDALGTGKVSNISIIQNPSPAFMEPSKSLKTAGKVAAGGIGAGLALAFLLEMLLDRTVRRSTEFGRILKMPLFLAVPNVPPKRPRSRRSFFGWWARKGKSGASGDLVVASPEVVTPDLQETLGPYYETLRDRLIGYFESRNLTHKPKLVAVTGLAAKSGVSSTAAGLARSLSESRDGNVLLVDLAPGHGSAQHFYQGRTVCDLEEVLNARDSAQIQERLFVVGNTSKADQLYRVLPQRFSKLVPLLKASDFDYIIFDMPTVSQISITPRLAGFMDMVLLVVESEKTSRDTVQAATALLAESRAHVGAVLNRTKNYVPGWLNHEVASGL